MEAKNLLSKNLLSPSPIGRPDTQATDGPKTVQMFVVCKLFYTTDPLKGF